MSDMARACRPSATSTGLDSRKMLMWLFLASDCMFFGSLIAMYMIYRGDAERMFELGQGGPVPARDPRHPLHLGQRLRAADELADHGAGAGVDSARQSARVCASGSAATALLGCVFLGGQFFEFTEFYHEGLGLTTNIFGSSFFTLTGFHGAHVTIGVIWLLSLVIVSLRGGLPQEQSLNVEIAGLYWHFVDIVWIVIFTLVYLIPYADGPEGAAEAAPHAFVHLMAVGERFLAAIS